VEKRNNFCLKLFITQVREITRSANLYLLYKKTDCPAQ